MEHLISIEGEQAVLGCLLDPEYEKEIIVNEYYFYNPNNREIFKAIKSVDGEVNIITVAEQLDKKLDLVGGISYLTELLDCKMSQIETIVNILKDKMIAREAHRTLQELESQLSSDITSTPAEIALRGSDKLREIGLNFDNKTVTRDFIDCLKDSVIRIDERHRRGDSITGLPIGFEEFDEKTCGFQNGEFVIIAARPGMGKTALALNMVDHLSGKDKKGVVFSLEMSSADLVTRMISSKGSIHGLNLKSGNLDDNEWVMLNSAVNRMRDYNVKICDDYGMTISDMRRELSKIDEVDYILIDYLQLIEAEGGENKTNQIGEISRKLKLLAKEYDCPVFVLSQLNREVEKRQNKRPFNSDLRDSGSLEQDADVIVFIYRDEYYNDDTQEKGVAELIIGKCRNGEIGTVKVNFQGTYSRFTEIDKYNY